MSIEINVKNNTKALPHIGQLQGNDVFLLGGVWYLRLLDDCLNYNCIILGNMRLIQLDPNYIVDAVGEIKSMEITQKS